MRVEERVCMAIQFIQLILQPGVTIWRRLFLPYSIYRHIFSALSVSFHLSNILKNTGKSVWKMSTGKVQVENKRI